MGMRRVTFPVGRIVAAILWLLLGAAGAASAGAESLISVFGTERSTGADLILFRNGDLLQGKVLTERFEVAAPYGVLDIPVKRCAGVSFEGSGAYGEEFMTVNRNRITGRLAGRHVAFRIASSGARIKVRKEKIRTIALRRREGEGFRLTFGGTPDLFLMRNGDLLSGRSRREALVVRSDYADMSIRFSEISEVAFSGVDNLSVAVKKRNGDLVTGKMGTEELTLDLAIGIRVEGIYRDRFRKIVTRADRGRVTSALSEKADRPRARGNRPASRAPGKEFVNALGMRFRLIPAGSFTMGSPPGQRGRKASERQHSVRIGKAFYMQTTEVTQGQWVAVMKHNPSLFKGETLPVENVSWFEAQAFVEKLNKMGDGVLYRLPTEAEWEYACRAGSRGAFAFGGRASRLSAYGWYEENADGRSHPVAKKKPNAWGLYDMHGNVWEWCLDRAEWGSEVETDTYRDGIADPLSTEGSDRIQRGGAWSFDARFCRSASRYCNAPGGRSSSVGFRLTGHF